MAESETGLTHLMNNLDLEDVNDTGYETILNPPETNFISFWHIPLPVAKWLKKLKPLSTNLNCITDIFGFTDEIRNSGIKSKHILVSYYVSPLFTIVPLNVTIDFLIGKAFENDGL